MQNVKTIKNNCKMAFFVHTEELKHPLSDVIHNLQFILKQCPVTGIHFSVTIDGYSVLTTDAKEMAPT